MSAEKIATDRKPTEKNTTATSAPADKSKALSAEDLDKVSGGLNPQPLPPIVRDSR